MNISSLILSLLLSGGMVVNTPAETTTSVVEHEITISQQVVTEEIVPEKEKNMVLSSNYDEVNAFSSGFSLVVKDDKYGFIDENFNEVISLDYDYATDFRGGIATAKIGEKTYMIDSNLNIKDITNYSDDFVSYNEEGVAVSRKLPDFKAFLIDINGNKVSDYYDNIYTLKDGLMCVEKDKKYGFIDVNGKEVIPLKLENIGYQGYERSGFHNGFATIEKDLGYTYIDKNGDLISEPLYDEIHNFREGLARVSIGSQDRLSVKPQTYGFIDENGDVVIDLQYDLACDFHNGLAYAEKDGKAFYIDKDGEIAFYVDFGTIDFSDNRAITYDKNLGLVGAIDTNGDVVIEPIYEFMHDFENGFSIARINDKYGVIDVDGNEILEFVHDRVVLVCKDYIIAEKSGELLVYFV